MFKSSLFKIFLFLIIFINNLSFADYTFQRLDIVEIEAKSNKDFAQKNNKKKLYGVVFSSKTHNASSTNIIIAPIVKSVKKVKNNDYTIYFKINGEEYTIFTDKLRSVSKSKLKQSLLLLKQEERGKIEVQFINITK